MVVTMMYFHAASRPCLMAVVADQDSGGDGRPFHRDPEDAQVVRKDRDDHRRDEGVHEGEVGPQGFGLMLPTSSACLSHPSV